MFARSTLTGLALSLALAAPAGAATLSGNADALLVTAAPGIENELVVIGVAPAQIYIQSDNDPVPYSAENPLPAFCQDIDAEPGTSPARMLDCTGVTAVTVDLGDLDDGGFTQGDVTGLTWLGNTGNDEIEGQGGAQTIEGGDGDDTLSGFDGADVIRGGGGSDRLDGLEGPDDVDGGAGEDILIEATDAAADVVRGGAGADLLFVIADMATDTFDGGDGIDTVLYASPGTESLFVDLSAGKAGTATESDSMNGIEDVNQVIGGGPFVFFAANNDATVTGDAGVNSIATAGGKDTIDPKAGNDLVHSRGGDDAIELRDGFADRVSCGEGADTVQADTLDVVAEDCETVTRTDSGNANDAPEDRAPTVAITSPSSAAVLSTVTPNTITATASDDRGIVQVIFSTGERNLCIDTTAPYSCDYRPTAADVGRDTIVAIAVDSAQQTASAVRVVSVPRFKATSLSASTTPKRDRRAPYRFTTKGKLALPAGVPAAAGCRGTVAVTFKAGKKTISTRRVALRSNCTYSSRVTFRLPRRLNPKTLTVGAVYGGNAVLDGIRAKRHTVRPR